MPATKGFSVMMAACAACLAAAASFAQNQGGQAQGRGRGDAAGAFAAKASGDPAAVARGRSAYATNCAYCHGEDARGAENGGINILRSDYVMKDNNGEVLRQFLLNPKENEHTGARGGGAKGAPQ